MYPMSGEARNLLSQPHTAVFKVDVLQSGRPVYTLDVVGGQVVTDADRPVRRNCGAQVIDPERNLTRRNIAQLLNAHTGEIMVFRGVLTSRGPEYVPQGVFQLTERAEEDDGTLALVGQDRSIMYQGGMTSSLAIRGGTPVEEAIRRLLRSRNPGLSFYTQRTGFTCGPLLFSPDIDVWGEALKLAESAGAWLFHDRLGRLVFGRRTPTSPNAVIRYHPGSGMLIDAVRTEDSDTIHNVIVMQSGTTSGGGIIQAVVEDLNPKSPTYARGRYGRRPLVVTNPYIKSISQARQAGQQELVRELGRIEVVNAVVTPHPGLDVLDMATVHNPEQNLYDRGVTLATTTLPLSVTEAMPFSTRKSVITRDGQMLDVPLSTMTS